MITKEQAALELAAQSILDKRVRYMIVTFNKKGKLICVEADPEDNWVCPSRLTANSVNYDENTWASKEQAEKMLTYVRKGLMHMIQSDPVGSKNLDTRSVEMLTIIKVTNTTVVVPKRVRTSPGGGQDDHTLRKRAPESLRAQAEDGGCVELSEPHEPSPRKRSALTEVKQAQREQTEKRVDNSHNWGFRGRIAQRVRDENEKMACGCELGQCLCYTR